jgi:Flp pilus assembly protein TadG
MSPMRRRPGRAFLGDQRGNVAIIAAAVLLPLFLATGFGIDYTLQTRARTR